MPRTFRDACRYNSGSAMCDSGDAYGRHHESLPIDDDSPVVTLDDDGTEATIHTGAFLDETMEQDETWQAAFDAFADCDENTDKPWSECILDFMEHHVPGWTQAARDNTYNSEQSLDQQFIFEVWRGDDSEEWIYDHDGIVIIQVHTGCDVRVGYSSPIFCRKRDGEYVLPLTWVAGFYVSAAINCSDIDDNDCLDACAEALFEGMPELAPDSDVITDDLWSLPGVDRLQAGYSSWPTGELETLTAKTFDCYHDIDKAVILTIDGWLYLMHPEADIY